jgi:hypothetical protein
VSGGASAADRWRAAAAVGVGLPAALGAYVFADLYLRVDLPGAAWLAHGAFRALVGPLEWLTEGEGLRLRFAVGVVAAVVLAAALVRPVRRVVWPGGALAVAGAQLLVLSLATLMERALAAGLLAGIAAAALLGLLRAGDEAPRPLPRWPITGAIVAAGGVASYYVYALFMTYGEGYALLRWAGARVRDDGVDPLAGYCLTVGLLLGGLVVAVLASPGGRSSRGLRLAAAWAAGTAVALITHRLVAQPTPLWPTPLVIGAGVSLLALAWAPLLPRSGVNPLDPQTLPRLLLLPTLLAPLLIGHTYAARIFRCGPVASMPGLERVASPGEVFRVTLGAGGTRAALTLRTDSRLGWLTVWPEAGPLEATDPGPAGHLTGDPRAGAGILAGVPEELVYAPSLDRYFATITPEGELAGQPTPVPFDAGPYPTDAVTNLILVIAGDGSRVIEALEAPGLCWVNTLRWAEDEGLLYVGCEDRPGVHRYDPRAGAFRDGTHASPIGDVQKIALHPQGSTLYTVSLWKTPNLTELSRDDLAVTRQLALGGSHYDVVADGVSGRVFASAFYGSRIRVVDGVDFRRQPSIPAGFGTRALALSADPHLLLASSVYDGTLRVCDPTSGETLATLPVGGHIKDIAIDQERDRAYFWSQCGLFSLDLSGWRAPARGL